MTKQEQIEEMAKFMHYKAHGKDKDCDNEKCEMCWCSCKNDAELLYNAGYRKIDDNCLVLSREEYKRITTELVTEQRATEIAKEYFEKIRKETAEKLIKLIEFHSISKRDKSGYETFTISNLCLKEILREEFSLTDEELENI